MKVCILAAGQGSRSAGAAMKIHKALLPLGNIAAISRIIAQFPIDASFVVALGHYADQMRDYLNQAHGDRDIVYVDVDRVTGPGSGPGYSLLCCRPFLQEPFIFTACDTLTDAAPPSLEDNWVGVSPVDQPERWCTVDADDNGLVRGLRYKLPSASCLAFIGIAGVRDYVAFWSALARGLAENGESQVNAGLEALTPYGLRAAPLSWLDVGDEEGYAAGLARYERNHSFVGKTTDLTYRLGDRVLKFFADPEISRRRYERGRLHPEAFAQTLAHQGCVYSYRWAPGSLLAEDLTAARLDEFLEWMETQFWRAVPTDPDNFSTLCRTFYRDKTLARLSDYLARHGDGTETTAAINGRRLSTAAELTRGLPEDFWSGGVSSTFHGDLHADNVVVDDKGKYTLIDWRQDFAGELEAGDRYYDLAKLFHTLDFGVEAMSAGAFEAAWDGDAVRLAHAAIPHAQDLQRAFRAFCIRHGYDLHRIAILNGLIFINMAPLYDRRLAEYLYLLGRYRLAEAVASPDGPFIGDAA